ncbi:MAG: hypothetical protein WBW81_00960 [Methylocella sp.]
MRFATIGAATSTPEGKPVHSFAGPEYVEQPGCDGNDDGDLRDYPCHLPYDPRQLHQLYIMLGDMCDLMREHAGQLAGHEKAQQP